MSDYNRGHVAQKIKQLAETRHWPGTNFRFNRYGFILPV